MSASKPNFFRQVVGLLCTAWLVLIPQVSQAGEIPGVRAEYFNYANSGNAPSFPAGAATVDRIEDTIDISFITTSPAPGIGADYYLTRYSGNILIPASGSYSFLVSSDDGVRLFVDCDNNGVFQAAELLVDQWTDHATTSYSASCPASLVAGQKLRFRVEYYERTGQQTVRLLWSGPAPVGASSVVIPKGDGAQGLYSGVADNVAPTVTSTLTPCGSTTQLVVNFSKQMQASSAQTLANYSISGGLSITSAALSADSMSVALAVNPGLGNTSKTLTVNNVFDIAGNPVAANTTANVLVGTVSRSPGLLGTYYSQNGTPGAYFTGTAVTRNDPNVDFSWGNANPGVTGIGVDNFSVRWTGLVLIPSTGNYTFRTLSDDGVRLFINGVRIIDNWTDHGTTTNSSSVISLTAGSYVPVTLEYYEHTGGATMRLQWQTPGGVFVAIPASQLFTCTNVTFASFSISGAGAASTCVPQALSVRAIDAQGVVISNYTGTAGLSSSSGRGDWSAGSGPAPGGSLSPGAANSGLASYTFATTDNGTVNLKLSHTLAQDVVVTVVDTAVSGSSSPSAAINYRDNAFSFSEDSANKISGSDVAVAGRPHDYTLTYLRKDPSTGACGPATDYVGSHALKLWRTDSSGSWTAPTVVSPALVIPAAQPVAYNLSLSFTAGVASFNLGSNDIGRYALSVRDDSLGSAANIISGSSNVLTVRPFVVMVSFVKYGATQNPNGSAATDTVFAPAGASFGATISAYTWAAAMLTNGADPNNTGTPAANATETAMKVGNLAVSFASTVSLSPLAASQTPAGGTLGSLNNGVVAGTGFSNGSATVASLQYTEVGSVALNTTGVVSNFLSSGLALDAVVVNASGAQNTRVGRFVPAGFVVGSTVLTHRPAAACSTASTFSHLDENFQFNFSLTAQNALGAKTNNYTGSFARLDLSVPANLGLAGIGGDTPSTPFVTGGRLALASSSGSWVNGLAGNVTLVAMALRAATPDGPFDSAQFGVAPLDADGVSMLSFNLDTSSPPDSADRSLLATVPLRFGRLRLQNAIGSQTRPLRMAVQGQYWNGSAFVPNPLDSCTRVSANNLSFGNFRKTLTSTDASLSNGPVTLSNGVAYLSLAAPAAGRSGGYEMAISLGVTAADASCLQSWTPGKLAITGASMAYLRGAWCSATYGKDPSARATFGLYRGNDATVYQRENY